MHFARVVADPDSLRLAGPDVRFSVLIHGETPNGRTVDLTRDARFRSANPAIAAVSASGVVRGTADGQTMIEIAVADRTLTVPVTVSDSQAARRFHFENDVVPILSRFGCNSSGCHGKAEGQNGFKLSVFGFDPPADHAALTYEGRGRRVFPPDPGKSLLLEKASGGIPHGGGVRIPRGSDEYRTLRDWIAAAMPLGDENAPRVVSLRLTPNERRMSMRARQQLRAVAAYSDGREIDVTGHARYQSNSEALASVDEKGLVTAGETPGEVAVMASYMGAVDVFRVLIPRSEPIADVPDVAVHNFIDRLVDAKLEKLNIAPSGLCDDATWLRRVSLDLIGTLPTADEARTFLSDSRPDKRSRLVERLLKRPEFADYWALKWSDLLRVDRQALGHKGAYQYYRWIRGSIAANKPYDRFVREIITAEGTLNEAPAGHLYKVVGDPGAVASTVSQVFLGVRIECAQCHHHPFDRWSQTDYYGMQAYFTQIGFKKSPRGEFLAALKDSPTKHPRTGEMIFAHPLGTARPDGSPEGDRRRQLADWMTSPENPWFARSFVNRIWAHMLGRGLIEPVDDLRSTNPPTNPELLDALARDFVEHGCDFHHLLRTIAASRTYQLSSSPNETNLRDEQNYSRALFKRLDAEVLFDAICQATGVPEKFDGMPAGGRAIQLWDSRVPHDFLGLFGRPVRATACECERAVEPSVAQVLHVLNSPEIHGKLSHAGGRIAKLVEKHPSDDAHVVEDLYLTFYSRYPTDEERRAAVGYLQKRADRRNAAEDIAWSMMNTVEFLFNH